MALKDKIKNWENELEKVHASRKEAMQKFEKKEKELLKKIEEGKAQLETENNRMVGDIVREMYGELNEENILRFRELMKKMRNGSQDA